MAPDLLVHERGKQKPSSKYLGLPGKNVPEIACVSYIRNQWALLRNPERSWSEIITTWPQMKRWLGRGPWAVQTPPRSQQREDEACIQGLSQALQPLLYDLCTAEPCGRHDRSEPNRQGAADGSRNSKGGTSERKIPPMFPPQNRWVSV